jgi:glycosyltransferase involved in cell wall biosynthesis
MKILLLIDKYGKGGGTEKVFDLYTQYCISHNYKVCRMTMYNSGTASDTEYLIENQHTSLFRKGIDQLNSIFSLRRIIKDKNIDCIVSFLDRSNLAAIWACLFIQRQIKITVTVHSRSTIQYLKLNKYLRCLFFFFLAWSYNRKKLKVIAVSQDVKDSLLSIGVKTVCIVYNPFELERIKHFDFNKSRAPLKTSVFRDEPLKNACFAAHRARNRKGTSENNRFLEVPDNQDIFIVAVGRLEHEKAYWKLIKSFHYYKKTYQDDLLKLYILGTGSFENELKDMCNNELVGSVSFLGYQENVIRYISKAQCMVFSSFYEGFPITLLECMSVRRPFIGSDNSIPYEIRSVLSANNIINTYHNDNFEINFDINKINNDEKELAYLIHKIQTDAVFSNTISSIGHDWFCQNCSINNFDAYLV